MIAIIDSGSTKSTWVFVDSLMRKHTIKIPGVNPYYQTSEDIYQSLVSDLLPNIPADEKTEKIFFYGAGCSELKQKELVVVAIKKAFPDSEVEVDHDLLAAARSLFGSKAGIACIAGTGSNTCYYDGEKIVENIYSPGLALGDEGSGGYLGKLLARDYIRKVWPDHLMKKFEAFTPDRTAEILDKIYKQPFPNRYLASLAPFVSKNIADPEMHDLAYESFDQLFSKCITRYEKHRELPIRFIGSIAQYLQPVLDEVAKNRTLKVDKVVGNPIDGLIEYHMQKMIL